MEPLYFPVIIDDDYEAFRRIMHDELAPTYNEWRKRHADRVKYWSAENKTIIEVQVKPDDFAAYLGAGGYGADMNRLYVFAELLGKR